MRQGSKPASRFRLFAIAPVVLLAAALLLGPSCGGGGGGSSSTPPVTQVPPLGVRPFENQGVGIQFWNRQWIPTGGNARAEFIESLDLLTTMNVNYVHVHFNVQISGTAPDGVIFDRNTDVTPTPTQFRDLMARLKERGFTVNLKLGFWHPGSGWAGMANYQPSDAGAWFTNWGQELTYWADLAEQTDVDAFDVAYEMSKLTTVPAYAGAWNTLIDGVEAAYTGTITANFQNPVEAQQAVFLNRLDLVMTTVSYKHVQTGNNDPTVPDLVASWTDASTGPGSVIDMNGWGDWPIDDSIVNEIEAIHTISGKPVMIGDIAFISLDGAASNWNSNVGIEGNPADPADQTDQYDAFFQVAAAALDPTWFKGVTFLTWFPFDSTDPSGPYQGWSWEIGPKGRSFRGKPAQQLIVDRFGGGN